MWLKESPEGPLPYLDPLFQIPLKICYALLWFGSRITTRKTGRASSIWLKRFREFILKHHSISYDLLQWFYSITSTQSEETKGAQDGRLIKIRVPKYNYQYYCRTGKGDFTPNREETIIEKFFKPRAGDTIIDVGAHIGRYTILGAKAAGSAGKVVAIEASPSNYYLLNRNVNLNGLKNVSTINCAAFSSDNARIKLYEPDVNASIYNTMMSARADVHNAKYVEVIGETLDTIVSKQGLPQGDINWIKIDVEGAELEVLKGAKGILSKATNVSILVEVHDIKDPAHFGSIVTFLATFGFRLTHEMAYDTSTERHVVFEKN